MDIEIKKLTKEDIRLFSDLISVFATVFEWDSNSLPGQLHLSRILENNNLIVLVAVKDNKVVGGLTVHVIENYDSEKPSAYIYDLAVLNNLQRKGIGKLLIQALNYYCNKNGFKDMFVQAETDDIHAVNFYRKTAVSSELQATHFTYSFNNEKRGDLF